MFWFLVVLYITLAIFITLGNFTVILVYSTEKKLRHSQEIFRLFLSVADMIMGLIVLPTAVNTMLKTYQHSLPLQTSIDIIGQEQFISTNGSYIHKNTTLTINMPMARNRLFGLVYVSSIGFFTNASFTVSVYLLTVSGIDRLLAVLKPFHYNQNVAKRFAISSSIFCWILAIFVSVLPTFVNGLIYKITAGGPVLIRGTLSLKLYLIEIILPLIATWIISILLYLITKKIFNRGRNSSTSKDDVTDQRQLNFVLSLMVGAFSLSLLPSLLVVLILFFFPGKDPELLETFSSKNMNIAGSLTLTVSIILASNSLWNFLLYSLRIKTFRKIALEKYKRIWNRINCFVMERFCHGKENQNCNILKH